MNDEFGTGLLKQPEDARDYSFGFVAAGAAPIDWSKEFRLPEPPDFNQRSSDSCTACAATNYHWQLKRKDYSRRDLFSRIAQAYGSYLRDGVKTLCEVGQQTQDECPDPSVPTPQNMRVRSAQRDSAGADDIEARYFLAGSSMEQMAQAVRDWNGALFGVFGDNAGWKDKTNPKPGEPTWAHALYAFGYHTHSGKKCLIAKSSWCKHVNGVRHHEHHLNEDYFKAGRAFDGWVLVPKEHEPMIKKYRVNSNGKLGVEIDYGFTAITHYAKSEDMYQRLLKDYEVPADAPLINKP